LKVEAEFVTSAASAAGLPREGLPEVAMVGRSNVGKSSLINSLVGHRVARTSAAPGKTRLANVYRVRRGSRPAFFLVDLPGYGYARGGDAAAREFEELTAGYFERVGQARQVALSAVLLVDARHAAMASDLAAWAWVRTTANGAAIVATKIDKLARGQRIRAMRELESAFDDAVLPVSAATREGLDELWTLIDRLANSPNPTSSSRNRPPRATVPLPPTRPSAPTKRPHRPRK
jgi:GTP-binding protein